MISFLTAIGVLFSPLAYAVQNGTLVEPTSSLAQSIISLGDTSSGTLYRSYCSGTLIAPNAIVTAAHCLAGKNPSQVIVQFGVNGMLTSVFRQGAQIFIPEQYQTYSDQLPNIQNAYDIGVLTFDGGLPSGFIPAVMVDQEITSSQNGVSVQVAGFGLPNRGELYECTTSILDGNFSSSEVKLSAGSSCSLGTGDSGGPLFEIQNGITYLFALNNWGWNDSNGNPLYFVDTRISYYAPWIRSVINPSVPNVRHGSLRQSR